MRSPFALIVLFLMTHVASAVGDPQRFAEYQARLAQRRENALQIRRQQRFEVTSPTNRGLSPGRVSRPALGNYVPQPALRGFVPQPSLGGYFPQPALGGYFPQPALRGFVPQPALRGFNPQPALRGFSPQPALRGFTPRPASSSR